MGGPRGGRVGRGGGGEGGGGGRGVMHERNGPACMAEVYVFRTTKNYATSVEFFHCRLMICTPSDTCEVHVSV